MKRTLLSFLIILCTALAVQAQPAPVYTLKSCLEQGLLNNYSLRITRNEQQVSKNNATLANAGYLPTLDLSAGYKVLIYISTLENHRKGWSREIPEPVFSIYLTFLPCIPLNHNPLPRHKRTIRFLRFKFSINH